MESYPHDRTDTQMLDGTYHYTGTIGQLVADCDRLHGTTTICPE